MRNTEPTVGDIVERAIDQGYGCGAQFCREHSPQNPAPITPPGGDDE